MKDTFEFADMKSIARDKLGDQVPLELFRTIRLISMYQALPMGGKSTTATIGCKIGESLPVSSVEDILRMFEELKIGIPSVVRQDEKGMRIEVDDCFCEGLPVLEGALHRVTGRTARVREVKCNVSGDERCEYEVRYGV